MNQQTQNPHQNESSFSFSCLKPIPGENIYNDIPVGLVPPPPFPPGRIINDPLDWRPDMPREYNDIGADAFNDNNDEFNDNENNDQTGDSTDDIIDNDATQDMMPPQRDHAVVPYNMPLIDPLCWPDRKVHGMIMRRLRKTMRFIGKVARLPGTFDEYDSPVYAEYNCMQVQYGDVVQLDDKMYVYVFDRTTKKLGWQLLSKLDAVQESDISSIVEAYNFATNEYVDQKTSTLSTDLHSQILEEVDSKFSDYVLQSDFIAVRDATQQEIDEITNAVSNAVNDLNVLSNSIYKDNNCIDERLVSAENRIESDNAKITAAQQDIASISSQININNGILDNIETLSIQLRTTSEKADETAASVSTIDNVLNDANGVIQNIQFLSSDLMQTSNTANSNKAAVDVISADIYEPHVGIKKNIEALNGQVENINNDINNVNEQLLSCVSKNDVNIEYHDNAIWLSAIDNVTSVDCTDFIKDAVLSSVDLCGTVLVLNFNTDAGVEPISVDLSSFVDNYDDKIEELSTNKADKTQLNDYYTKSETSSAAEVSTALDSKADKTQLDSYYTKSDTSSAAEIQTAFDGKQPTGDYALVSQIPLSVSQLENDSSYLTEHQSLSDYYTKSQTSSASEVSMALDSKADVSSLQKKITIDNRLCNIVEQTDLSVVKLSSSEYYDLVNSDTTISNVVYVVENQFENAYSAQIKNLAPGTDLSDAVNLEQLSNALSSIKITPDMFDDNDEWIFNCNM